MQIRGQTVPADAWCLYYQLKDVPTISGASLRMFMATTAMEECELRGSGMEQASVQAMVDEKTHTELLEEYQELQGAVDRLNK